MRQPGFTLSGVEEGPLGLASAHLHLQFVLALANQQGSRVVNEKTSRSGMKHRGPELQSVTLGDGCFVEQFGGARNASKE